MNLWEHGLLEVGVSFKDQEDFTLPELQELERDLQRILLDGGLSVRGLMLLESVHDLVLRYQHARSRIPHSLRVKL